MGKGQLFVLTDRGTTFLPPTLLLYSLGIVRLTSVLHPVYSDNRWEGLCYKDSRNCQRFIAIDVEIMPST